VGLGHSVPVFRLTRGQAAKFRRSGEIRACPRFAVKGSKKQSKGEKTMVQLSWWEQFIVSAVVSFLTVLTSKVTNTTEQAGLQSSTAFLQKLLSGQVSQG
jgi:hypothetical protein